MRKWRHVVVVDEVEAEAARARLDWQSSEGRKVQTLSRVLIITIGGVRQSTLDLQEALACTKV